MMRIPSNANWLRDWLKFQFTTVLYFPIKCKQSRVLFRVAPALLSSLILAGGIHTFTARESAPCTLCISLKADYFEHDHNCKHGINLRCEYHSLITIQSPRATPNALYSIQLFTNFISNKSLPYLRYS